MLASKVWEERQQKPVVVMPDGGGEELVGRERGEMERALEEKRREASEAARAFELKHAFYPRSKELKEQEEREAARQQKEMGEEEKEAFEMATKAKTELLEVQMKQVAVRKEQEAQAAAASATTLTEIASSSNSSSSSSDSTVYADTTSSSREQLHVRKEQMLIKIKEVEKATGGLGKVSREVRLKGEEAAKSTKELKGVREIVVEESREKVRDFIEEQGEMWEREGRKRGEEIWESTGGKALNEMIEAKDEVLREVEKVRQINMELDAIKATLEQQQQQRQQQQQLGLDLSEEPSKQEQQHHHHLRLRTAESTGSAVEEMQQHGEEGDGAHVSLSSFPKSEGKEGKKSKGKHYAARELQEAEAILASATAELALMTGKVQGEVQAWEATNQELQGLLKELQESKEAAKHHMRVDPFLLEQHSEGDGSRILTPLQSLSTEAVAETRAEKSALLDREIALIKEAEALDELARECTKSNEEISATLTALEETMRLEREQRDVVSAEPVPESEAEENVSEQEGEGEIGPTKEQVVEAFRQLVRTEIQDLETRAWDTLDIPDSPVEEEPEVPEGLSATERAVLKNEQEEREVLDKLIRIIQYASDESLRENLEVWTRNGKIERMLDQTSYDKKIMEMELALKWRNHLELTRLVEHLGMVNVSMAQLRAGAFYVGVHGAIEAEHGFDYARWFHGADVVLDRLHTTPPYTQMAPPNGWVDDVLMERVPPSLPLHWPRSQTRGKKVGECYCMALAPGLSPPSYTIKFHRPLNVNVLSTLSLTHFYRPWYVLRWFDYVWQPKRDEYHYDTVGSMAPREVILWGVPSMKATRKGMKMGRRGKNAGLVWLGNFTFLIEEPFYRTQFWPLIKPEGGREGEKIEGVRLEIVSNHGNEEYTCLYRVGVYGERVEEYENDEPWMGWLHAIKGKLGEFMALGADRLESLVDEY
eukprot:evm.model.NODE_4934_length_6975_cov_57.108101.1